MPSESSRDEALVSVHRRPEGYHVATSARSSAGWWQATGVTVVVPLDADEGVLAGVVVDALLPTLEEVPAPSGGEWADWRKHTLGAMFQRAGVRSWRAFAKPALTVDVAREGRTVVITPMQRAGGRVEAFIPMTGHEIVLPELTIAGLLPALGEAWAAVERAEATKR